MKLLHKEITSTVTDGNETYHNNFVVLDPSAICIGTLQGAGSFFLPFFIFIWTPTALTWVKVGAGAQKIKVL
jgi:hypothetical protein